MARCSSSIVSDSVKIKVKRTKGRFTFFVELDSFSVSVLVSLLSGAASPAIREDLREPVEAGGAAEVGFLGGIVEMGNAGRKEKRR